MIPWLAKRDRFPPVSSALAYPNGLLAAGADLSVERLIEAYRLGIFPWSNVGEPLLWWCPHPRMVLFPSELKISRSLAKALRNRDYEVRLDTSFRAVMHACAGPRLTQAGTWISEEMIAAYCDLHERGYAHSVETWIGGELAGGLYGVALGRVFFGESMFSCVADASKIALVYLVRRLVAHDYSMIDCQMRTTHLATLGAREIGRDDFVQRLGVLVNYPGEIGHWT